MTNPPKNMRKTNICDRTVQGILLLHVAGHWLLFLFAAAGLVLFIEILSGNPHDAWKNMANRHGPSVLAILVLAPLFLRDLCKLTNRVAGPMVCMRRALRGLADGREVAPIQFRERDFWKDMATDFNRVLARTQTANPSAETCGGKTNTQRCNSVDNPGCTSN